MSCKDGFYHTAQYFEVMQLTDQQLVASPMPINPLYRGQSAIYDPCNPSLYRGQWTKLKKFERLLQLADFKKMMDVLLSIICHSHIRTMRLNM